MKKRELIDLCLQLPGTYEDTPFRDTGWVVVRHKQGGKVFAWVYEREGKLQVNLKCEPMRADFLRSVYGDVTPGYHLNKTHWNTVDPNGDVPLHELMMIQDSHRLTMKKTQRRAKTRQGKK